MWLGNGAFVRHNQRVLCPIKIKLTNVLDNQLIMSKVGNLTNTDKSKMQNRI